MTIGKQEIAKRAAGQLALTFVRENMTLGLGTGSTTFYFIEALGKLCQNGMKVRAVSTSSATESLAQEAGIPLIDINTCTRLDLCVDGADEIDPKKRMIKGGGGALLREKIVASISHEMIVVIDESKCVERLGKFPLPIEVVPFAHGVIQYKLKEFGYNTVLRGGDPPFITDNQNYIIDAHLPSPIDSPEEHEEKIQAIPGVVETGFFFGLAGRVVVGHANGEITVL